MSEPAEIEIRLDQGSYVRVFAYDELSINETRHALTLVATRREPETAEPYTTTGTPYVGDAK
jgi:hypothetical protein